MIFKNREEAGRRLAAELLQYRNDPRGLILALPRGGVAVGFRRKLTDQQVMAVLAYVRMMAPFEPHTGSLS